MASLAAIRQSLNVGTVRSFDVSCERGKRARCRHVPRSSFARECRRCCFCDKGVTDRLLGIPRTLEAGCRLTPGAMPNHVFQPSLGKCAAISIWNRRSTIAWRAQLQAPRQDLLHERLRKRSRATLVAPRCKIVSRPTANDSARASRCGLEKTGVPGVPVAPRNLF